MRCFLLIQLALAWFSVACCGAEPSLPPKNNDPIPQAVPRITIETQNTGKRLIHIDYPWQAYQKASVEVWLVTKDSPANAKIKPTYFVDYRLKGETSVKVGECLASAYSTGSMKSVPDDKMTIQIVGLRNSLGKPAVSILGKSKRDQEEAKDKEEPKVDVPVDTSFEPPLPYGSWAAFCDLENWSLNRHELSLDLLSEHFARPGKLYIWFLRGDKILWEERLDWKGY
jgi:hypothetical protein